ncbi:hypothetical protein UY3_16480 [Chelonia mydas]|uniref:Myb/SANT-like DNA-binding domain-containing protein n=1 Tax=Chelonia mydas TaxID=8469 RepID=M7APE7_CHEMY|nr:hypothetical protein UY3_16480 [Chelonia mydas]
MGLPELLRRLPGQPYGLLQKSQRSWEVTESMTSHDLCDKHEALIINDNTSSPLNADGGNPTCCCYATAVFCFLLVPSSPAQLIIKSQDRKRAPAWSTQELVVLIAVWEEESMQAELRFSRRNADLYAKIVQGMGEKGYTRDMQQCCVKIKELHQA